MTHQHLLMVSHELRTPVGSIRNAVQSLRRRDHCAREAVAELGVIERQVNHILRLIEDLEDHSAATLGKLAISMTSTDLGAVVWRAIEASQHLINAAGHRLQVSVPTHRIELVADEARLVQAVTNILNNAAKYVPPGGHIWMNALEGANEATITVRDDGPGIAAGELATIFEPFSRGAGSRRSDHAGFGVGLALAQSLVRMHGGRINVQSAGPGTGSEFTIRLPLRGLGQASG